MKPKFVAEIVNNEKEIELIQSTTGIPTFDLSKLNLLQLSQELQKSLDSKSSMFIWRRERQNQKLLLEREKIKIILETIKDLTLTQKELINFQAETFLSNEMLSAIIANNRLVIKEQLELKKKEFLLIHKQLDDGIVKIDHEKRAREIDLEARELDNLRKRAELNLLNAQTEEAKAKAQLIIYVVNELNLKNMPQTLQTYLISSIVNPQGSQYQDFDMQEQLKKFVIKEADARARITAADASIKESTAITTSKTKDKMVIDIDSLINSVRNIPKSK